MELQEYYAGRLFDLRSILDKKNPLRLAKCETVEDYIKDMNAPTALEWFNDVKDAYNKNLLNEFNIRDFENLERLYKLDKKQNKLHGKR